MPETIVANSVAYIGVDQYKAKVIRKEKDAKRPYYNPEPWTKAALLWGDPVFVRSISGNMAEVSAKGHRLAVPLKKLTNDSILSLWQIDVGQGDATLIRFPDDKWAMVDLGPPRHGKISTNSARTAEDFLKWIAFQDNNWQFETDATKDSFHLDWLVISHPDEDHFGAGREMLKNIGKWWSIGTVYHCGLGRFKGQDITVYKPATDSNDGTPGFSQLGIIDGESENKLYVTSLIDHFADVGRLQSATNHREWTLTGTNYAKFLYGLYKHKGDSVGNLKRLSHLSNGSKLNRGGVEIKVLGPIEESAPKSGKPALRYLDNNKTDGYYNLASPSLTRNGQSVVLRLDFDDVKIMLTGDLNFKSQALLQKVWSPSDLKCHIAKACHHGSDDVSWQFLKAMSPMATMFSSGDQETHVHPRALILGLSGGLSPLMKMRTARSPKSGPNQKFKENSFDGFTEELVFTPLLYSTELSRSVRLRSDMKAYSRSRDNENNWQYEKLRSVHLKGGSTADKHTPLSKVRIADKLTYGLINVRTDGTKILIAVLEEGNSKNPEFHVEAFSPKDMVEVSG